MTDASTSNTNGNNGSNNTQSRRTRRSVLARRLGRALHVVTLEPWQVVEFLLLATLFLLPLQTRYIITQGMRDGAAFEYATSSLYGTDILILLAAVATLFWWDRIVDRSALRKALPVLAGAWLFWFVACCSILFATSPLIAVFWGWNLFIGVVLCSVLVVARPSWKRIAWTFLTTATLQAIVGLIEWQAQTIPASSWLGMSQQLREVAGVQVVETELYGRVLRAYGTMPHPNIFAGYLAVGVVSGVAIFLELGYTLRTVGTYTWKDQQRRGLLRIVATLCIAVLSLGIWVSASRQAILALVLVLGLATLWAGWQGVRARAFNQDFVRLGLALLVPYFVMSFAFPWYVAPRAHALVEPQTRLEQQSIETRKQYMHESLNVIRNKWATGVGVGNYTQHYEVPVHNIYLLIAAELGTIGIASFALLILSLIQAIRRLHDGRIHHAQPRIVWGVLSMSILLVIGLFDHYLYSLHAGTLLFWATVSFAFLGTHDRQK